MAIYHCCVKAIGGNSGRSAVGASAYRTGAKLRNEKDSKTHDYRNRRGNAGAAAYHSGERLPDGGEIHDFTAKGNIIHSEIILPNHAPREFQDRGILWNSAQNTEKQHNARTAREVEVALPNELTEAQNIELVRDFVRTNFVDVGMCADFSIHAGHSHKDLSENPDAPIKPNNPHAHIMLTVRPLNADGSWGAKSKKEYILDKNGDRIKLPSGEWKSRKVDYNGWDRKESLLKWRKNWADTCNKHLKMHGFDVRIDHRTLAEQGIDREPQIHVGVKAWAMEKRGIETERGRRNRAIIARNAAREAAALERIDELQDAFVVADKRVVECAESRREADYLSYRAEDMAAHVADFETRHTSESQHVARERFRRKFGVEIEAAPAEIQRLTAEMAFVSHGLDVAEYRSLRDEIKAEYQKQRLLAEYQYKDIYGRIQKPAPQLEKVTDEQFSQILREVRPAQAAAMIEHRERTRERWRSHERSR